MGRFDAEIAETGRVVSGTALCQYFTICSRTWNISVGPKHSSGAKTQPEAPCWSCRTQYKRMDATSQHRYVFSLVPRGQGGHLQPWLRGGSPVGCVLQSVGPTCGWGLSQSMRAAASCRLCPLSCSWVHNPVGCTSFFLNQVTAVMTSIVKLL